MTGESIRQQTISGVKWSSVEKFSTQGIHFIISLILARLLTPEDFGTVGMTAVFLEICNTFLDSGFGKALAQKKDRTQVDYSTVFYFNLIVSIVCYTLLFLAAPLIANFFKTPVLCSILRVQSLVLFTHAFMHIQSTILTIKLDFKNLAIRTLISAAIGGVAGIILAYMGFGVWAIVWQGLIGSTASMIFLWTFCGWKPSLVFSHDSFVKLFKFGGNILGASLLNTIYRNLTSMVIGRFYTSADLGVYSRGVQFAKMPFNTIMGILGKVTFPILAKIQDDREKLLEVYRKYIFSTSTIIFICCTTLAACAKPLILLLLTNKWEGAIVYLQIFCIAVMFDHITAINMNLIQAVGKSKLYFKAEIIKKIIGVAILCVSVKFGVIAIALSKIVYSQSAIAIGIYFTSRTFNFSMLEQYRDFSKILFYAVISSLPAYFIAESSLPLALSLALGVVTSFGIYYILQRKNPYIKEVQTLVWKALLKR